jgi:glycerophosphoryl diester phosphodiesterase
MKLQESNNTQVGGHRGLPLVYPDNTLEGITAAAEVADFIELDVRRSADGLMVLSHEPALRETTIHDHAWEELRNIDLGGGYHPALLQFILDALPYTPLDIEIKNSPLQPGFDPGGVFAVEVAACARPFDVVTCFFWPTMDIVKRALPHVRTGLLVDEGGSLTDAVEAAVAAGHEVVAPHFSLLINSGNRPIDQAHDAGLEVVTWTVNDVAVAARLVGDGVDGIISDDPERIQQEQP